MSRRPARCDQTPDLLAWQPPAPQVTYQPDEVRGATLAGKISRAIGLAMKECGKSRGEIAAAMSDYLGEEVSEHMLNAYASEARDEHRINLVRFAGLAHATEDYRLLSLVPELFGFAVIEQRYLPAIEQAMIDDRIKTLKRHSAAANRRWKGGA